MIRSPSHRIDDRHGSAVSVMSGPAVVMQKASGLIQLPEGKSERDLLEEALAEKYELSN